MALKHTLEAGKLCGGSDHPAGWELSCALQQLQRNGSSQPFVRHLTWALGNSTAQPAPIPRSLTEMSSAHPH